MREFTLEEVEKLDEDLAKALSFHRRFPVYIIDGIIKFFRRFF
jgi:hypothetical protein